MQRTKLEKFTPLLRIICLFSFLLSLALSIPGYLYAVPTTLITLSMPSTVVPGSSFTISGTLMEGAAPLANRPLGITIKDAQGAIFAAAEIKTGTDGSFTQEFTLPADALTGTWEIHTAGEGAYSMKNFTVEVLTTGVASASPASLRRGETVTISGTLPQGNVEVGLTIYDSNEKVVFVDQKKTAADGKYQFNYTLPADAVLGTYRALVAGAGTAGEATFTVTAPSPSGGGGGGGTPAPPSNKKDIGPTGGEFSAFGAKIEIPPGALEKTVTISIQKIDPAQVPPFSPTFKLMGEIYEFGPAGTKFNKPVTIILKYEPTKLEGVQEDTLAIYYLDEQGNWVKLTSFVDKASKTVSAQVNRLSKYTPLAIKKEIKEEVSLPFGFKDLPENHWAWEEIKKLFTLKIAGGYPDGTFKPENSVSRAEFTKMLVNALGISEEITDTPIFKDIGLPGSSTPWYFGWVQAAAKADLVKGYPGNEFRPENFITREEMSVMLARALGQGRKSFPAVAALRAFKDQEQIAPWANSFVGQAIEEGLVTGYPDHTFKPQRNTTRAETCVLVFRILKKKLI
ncbi:MAG: hypothetical protein STSR0004_14630 [Peptococcaceae bacterium]